MDDLIGELWKQCPLFITREQFARSLEGWTFDPIYTDGVMSVVFIVKGAHFHFAKFDKKFQASRAVLAKYPGSLIAKYGYAETKTPKDDMRQRRFNEKLGFVATGEDEYDITYRIERMKGMPCRS